MSREPTGDPSRDEGTSRGLESYEQRQSDQPDVQLIHGPIYREKAEPRDGHQPIPMWLLAPVFALLLWGGWYLGEHSGDFRAENYEGPQAFTNSGRGAQQTTVKTVDPMVVGRRVYNSCASCHQTDGQGIPGTYPPLAGAEWVNGDPRLLTRILLHGLEGPLTVGNARYNGAMPAWSNLSDEEISSVMTFIRQSWGNDAEEVPTSLVKDVRQTEEQRRRPWTQSELDRLREELPKRPLAAEEKKTREEIMADESVTVEDATNEGGLE